MARAGLDKVRRIGRIDFLAVLVANATYAAYRTGDWDWAVQQCLELEAAAVADVDRATGMNTSIVIDAARGHDVDDRVAASDQVLRAGSDNQAQANARDLAGNVAFAQGRLDDAYEALTAAARMISWLAPTAYLTAARAALWLRDPVRARDALEKLDATTHGPVISAGHATIEAGLIALSGDVGGALTRYRASLEAWRELGLRVDIALTAIDMATLIGPGDPAVAAAAAEAREILTALGAEMFLARLEAAMGSLPAASPEQPITGSPIELPGSSEATTRGSSLATG